MNVALHWRSGCAGGINRVLLDTCPVSMSWEPGTEGRTERAEGHWQFQLDGPIYRPDEKLLSRVCYYHVLRGTKVLGVSKLAVDGVD